MKNTIPLKNKVTVLIQKHWKDNGLQMIPDV